MNSVFPNIIPDPIPFVSSLLNRIKLLGIDSHSMYCDHICYRVESLASYYSLKLLLCQKGNLLSEKIINGRPISSIIYKKGILVKGNLINVLELPSPSPSKPYKEGYEHIEMVIDGSIENFIESHPNLPFKTKGLKKSVNRDIKLIFPEGSVKFHEQSLEWVIKNLDK